MTIEELSLIPTMTTGTTQHIVNLAVAHIFPNNFTLLEETIRQ